MHLHRVPHDQKVHFKLLKSGKLWLTVAITGITFGTALLTNVTVSAAATNPAAAAMSVDSWMPDKNLQNAVIHELRSEGFIKSSDSTFTQADLAKMTKLSINYNQPSNLSGLQYASKLSILSVASFGTNNGISDLSPLANLTQLQQLDLDNNNITDVSPLAKLTSLQELHLNSNKISDISVLSGLHNLTNLEVGYNSITDLTPLSGLHLLSNLNISGNAALSNLNSLASLTNLESLRAAYLPALTDITGIKNAVKLSKLELENDNLTDVAALQNISSLTKVVLDSNHISDLSPLSKSFQGTIVQPNNLSAINQTVAMDLNQSIMKETKCLLSIMLGLFKIPIPHIASLAPQLCPTSNPFLPMISLCVSGIQHPLLTILRLPQRIRTATQSRFPWISPKLNYRPRALMMLA